MSLDITIMGMNLHTEASKEASTLFIDTCFLIFDDLIGDKSYKNIHNTTYDIPPKTHEGISNYLMEVKTAFTQINNFGELKNTEERNPALLILCNHERRYYNIMNLISKREEYEKNIPDSYKPITQEILDLAEDLLFKIRPPKKK
jgi:hypothetical protein